VIPALLILYIIVCISAGAIADGLNDTGHGKAGHLLEAAEMLLALTGATIFAVTTQTLIPYLTAYIGFRIALFDIIYNISSHRKVFSQGSGNVWDDFLSKYPQIGVVFMRMVFLLLAIGISIRYF